MDATAAGATAPFRPTPARRRARPPGIWRQAWYRFRRNRAGMIGLGLVGLVVLIGDHRAVWSRPTIPTTSPPCWRGAANAAPSCAQLARHRPQRATTCSAAPVYGAPTALAVGLGAMLIASLIGVMVGGIAGYFGGFIDEALMRGAEFFMVVPVFVVILAVVRLFGIIVVGNTAGAHSATST